LRRTCLLKHVIEEKIAGKIGVTGRRRRGRKPSLHDFKETRRYRKLKERALDRSVWRTPLEESMNVGQDSLPDADDP
jgi:hypothetical protein